MNSNTLLSKTALVPVAKLLFAASLLAGGLFLSGCETTSAPVPAVAKEQATVTKGMTEAEVLAILGEPMEVKEISQVGAVATIWRYEKEVVLSSTIESDGEQERVYNDPVTGKLVTVREPIWRNEKVMGTITAEILFAEGKVVALKEVESKPELKVGN